MPSLERIQKRIVTANELQSVVTSMKGMAAANVRHFQAAVESLRDYTLSVERSFRIVLHEHPEHIDTLRRGEPEHLAAVVFGSEQGMSGRFNRQIVDHATARLSGLKIEPQNRTLWVVGERVRPTLEEADYEIADVVHPPSSLAGITEFVYDLLIRIEDWREKHSSARVLLFYNRSLGGASYQPETLQLVPIDTAWLEELRGQAWPARSLPMTLVPWQTMFANLVREYLFIMLFRASAESLASENASRLAAMQSAERNIEDRLDELNRQYRHDRQTAITEELLDIAAGFEALGGGEG